MSLNSHATALIKYKKFWNEDAKETADFIFSETPITRGMPQKVRAYHSFIKSLNKLNIYGYLIKEQILTKDELFGGVALSLDPISSTTLLTTNIIEKTLGFQTKPSRLRSKMNNMFARR